MKKIELNPLEVRALQRLVPSDHEIIKRITKAEEAQKETIRNTCYGFHQYYYDRMTIKANFDINDAYYILNKTPYNYISATEKKLRNKFLSIVQNSIKTPTNNHLVQLRDKQWIYVARTTSWKCNGLEKKHQDFLRFVIYIWNNKNIVY